MTERVGRAWPYLIVAPILAFVLLAVAIVVAIGGPGALDATSTPTPAATAAASSSTPLVTASPSAASGVVRTARLDDGLLVLSGPEIELRYAELSAVLPGE